MYYWGWFKSVKIIALSLYYFLFLNIQLLLSVGTKANRDSVEVKNPQSRWSRT